MNRGHVFLAGCLFLVAVSALVLVQLHRPTSWLSQRIDGGTTLPAATS